MRFIKFIITLYSIYVLNKIIYVYLSMIDIRYKILYYISYNLHYAYVNNKIFQNNYSM